MSMSNSVSSREDLVQQKIICTSDLSFERLMEKFCESIKELDESLKSSVSKLNK